MKNLRFLLLSFVSSLAAILLTVSCCSSAVTYAGKTYATVKIGDQCWLKENLDVGTMIDGNLEMSDNGTIEKYCYDNNPDNCNTYGGLYKWGEVMQYATTDEIQGLCPGGWHVATHEEYQILLTTTGESGNALKAVGQGMGAGAGTNTSGFSALLAGNRNSNGGFTSLGAGTHFWTSTVWNAGSSYELGIITSDDNLGFDNAPISFGFSVRCLKD